MDMNCSCKENSLYIQIWDSFGICSYSSSRLSSENHSLFAPLYRLLSLDSFILYMVSAFSSSIVLPLDETLGFKPQSLMLLCKANKNVMTAGNCQRPAPKLGLIVYVSNLEQFVIHWITTFLKYVLILVTFSHSITHYIFK